ncbi:MAG: hypothetical protein AAF547_09220 [Actinomycetota bacterium]
MHPVSTAFFLLGYGLSLPIATRLAAVVAGQHRLAMWGHQLGMVLAAVGWLLRGQVLVGVGHILWMTGAGIWFRLRQPRAVA